MDKDNWWSPKEPIKATLQNVEVIIHSPKQEDEIPPKRKSLLKVELLMMSGKRYNLFAYGYYEEEFDEFLVYLKGVKWLLTRSKETLINVDAIELVRKVRSNCFVETPDAERRKLHIDKFAIEERR